MATNDVRIKVSMEGDKLVIAGLQGIGDGAGEADSKLGGLVKGGLAGAGKALLGLGVAAGAAGVAMSTAVIKAYADYEQNLGGIETMFGDHSAKMVEYANQAYQTAGLSANAYMSNVTSFSAALLQGLGGDTELAAEIANQAMVDMSDNANKFGTDLTSIQTAYQGFAKQNFTMLDNLKLGYGGTQAEMARLINDSGVLGDTMTVTAANVNEVSFDKIIEAIHVVQDEMGVAGTTALEASTTISGSIGTLRGAFENLLTGLGDADADVATLAGNVIASFETVVTNIAPVIENIGAHMVTLGPQLGTMMESLIGTISGAIPAVLQAGVGMIGGLISGITSALPGLITAIVPAIVGLVQMISTQLPLLVDAGMKALIALGQGISQALPTLIPVAVEAILGVVDAIIQNLPMLLDTGLQLLMALQQGILEALPVLIEALPDIIIGIVDFLIGAIPMLIETGINLFVALVEALPEIINGIVAAIPKIISSVISAVIGAIPQLIEAGIQLFIALIQNLPTIIATIVGAIPQIIGGIIGALGDALPQMAKMGLQLIQGLWNGISDATGWLINKIGGFVGDVMGAIGNFFGIASPSRRMKLEIGRWLPPGIGEGVADNEDAAIKPIQEMNRRIMLEASLPELSINRTFQTTNLSTLSTQYATPTPRVSVSSTAQFGEMFGLMMQELRATPLEAQISDEGMAELADQVRRGLVSVRSADGMDAQMAVMREVR